jgi:hypothetical protein
LSLQRLQASFTPERCLVTRPILPVSLIVAPTDGALRRPRDAGRTFALLVLLAAVAASLSGCIFEGGAGGPFM